MNETDPVKDQLCARIEELEKEKLELNEQLDELQKERDALAAHLERLTKAALDAIHFLPGGEIKAELRDSYDSAPATSLARLKAECWKEAYRAGMEYGHHWTVEGGYVPGDEEAAEDYVADRQAEGDKA